MSELVIANYNDISVAFTDDAWFNATAAAERFGKRVDNWLRLQDTQEYMTALSEVLNPSHLRDLVKTRRGKAGGTWLHPKLAVRFAQWLDMRFAVWCDMQIDALIKRTHPHHNRQRLRHEAAASYKVMGATLQMARELQGKTVSPHHFMTEARLVNWVLAGEFKGIDRDALSSEQLDLLAKLEEHNTVLIGCGISYEQRKVRLPAFAESLITHKIESGQKGKAPINACRLDQGFKFKQHANEVRTG